MASGERNPLRRGLTHRDAEKRLAEFGPNALPEPVPPHHWERWLRQFKSPLIYILLFALVLDLSLWLWEGAGRLPLESTAIVLILVLNAGLGAYQETRPKRRWHA
jgi:P-type Ca2+ transporter type 2C